MLMASCVLSCVLAGGDRASRVRRAVREARCSSRLYLSAFTEDLDQGAGISPFVILAQDEHERLLTDHSSRAHRGVRASTLADETEASMALIDGMLEELEQEARTTRRVLERVPDAQLGWRPHEKARTLGQLALHVAMVPGAVAELAAKSPPIQAPSFGQDPSPGSASELVQALDVSIANARKILGGMDDAALMAKWGFDARRARALRRSTSGVSPVDHAESLVPPSRTADDVPASAGCAVALNLRPQC